MNYANPNPQGYQPPVEMPIQPTQPVIQPYVQPAQPAQPAPIVNNGANFIADSSVLSIMQTVHPELKSAMINLAIKKFSEESDFLNYFVMEQFKQQALAHNEQKVSPQTSSEKAGSSKPDAKVVEAGADFSSW